jgi:3-methyladenine DNA glycosylase AlkD
MFNDYIWNKKSYNEFITYLKDNSDKEYQEMSSKITNGNLKVIGTRIPVLRKIAKEISRGDYSLFIKYNNHEYFEEVTIHGLIIGYLMLDINDTVKMLESFVPYIDNWGTNDVVASTLKTFKKNQTEGFNYISTLVNSNNPWSIRFGLILLLSHFINEDYIDKILDISNRVEYDHYYVKMGNAWLISMCYVKFKDKTNIFLKDNNLDKWTHNKAIQKIKESLQVSLADKKYVETLKKR